MTNTKKKNQEVPATVKRMTAETLAKVGTIKSKESDKPVEKQVTEAQQTELDKLPTISAKIRYLDKENFTRSRIAKIMDKRYQHIRNVLETPLKRKIKTV